jgi:hypothetical protein
VPAPLLSPGARKARRRPIDLQGTPEYARSKLRASVDNGQVVIRRELRNSALHVAFAQIIDPEPDPGKPSVYRYNKPGLMARRIMYRLAMKEVR